MRWASAVSEEASLEGAIQACAAAVDHELQGPAVDLAVVFVSNHFAGHYAAVPGLLQQALPHRVLLGCSAAGIIGGGHEVEQRPAFSLTAAHLPEVEIAPFRVENGSLPNLDGPPQAWERLVGVAREDRPSFVLLADPYSFRPEALLAGLDFAFPDSPKIGGLASGANGAGGNALYLGGEAYRAGVVGVALQGNILVDTLVAQGCRPIGAPMRVTRCQQNILLEVDERPPLLLLQELYQTLGERDQGLFRQSLFLGVVMDELRSEAPRQGDFLIRNLVGADAESGSLAIGEYLREGQTVQFHLRDAFTSAEDLAELLGRYREDGGAAAARGALLFSCLGRGAHLYGRPDHDTDLFRDRLGPIPLGGFFCNGEIGPVGGATYLHGYTSSFGIFRPARDPPEARPFG